MSPVSFTFCNVAVGKLKLFMWLSCVAPFMFPLDGTGFLGLGVGQQRVQGLGFASSETISSVHPGEISSGALICTNKRRNMDLLIHQ